MAGGRAVAAAVVAVVLAGAMAACGETVYVQQEDAGGPQDAGLEEDAPPCGPDVYPCPPYGVVADNVFEDLTFTGWVDDNQSGDPLDDEFRVWAMDMFYQRGRGGQAKFLYLNVSAGWCTVCQAENRQLPGYFADFHGQGIDFAEILFETYNEGEPATKDFVREWTDYYNLPFPVGLDPSFKTGRYFDKAATPANIIIDLRTMKIWSVGVGWSDTSARATLAALADTP
ncbi:MAG: redoxin domain-containing protein [Deltaproteobacteria bacterium]|nr:redoxin domain-containing protein [Deltaproteobacteria bacterium]